MPYEEQFSALSHPLRQQILRKLSTSSFSVRELTDQLDASQPVVSQHLKVLKDAGFVTSLPQGMKNLYQIEPKGLSELRAFLENYWTLLLSDIEVNSEEESKN